jgi:hypothetical protein
MDALLKVLKFRAQYKDFIENGVVVWLEKMDKLIPEDPMAKHVIDYWTSQSPRHRAFFEYHKQHTEPVFGKWNYDKY